MRGLMGSPKLFSLSPYSIRQQVYTTYQHHSMGARVAGTTMYKIALLLPTRGRNTLPA